MNLRGALRLVLLACSFGACTPARDAWSEDARPVVGTWRAKCSLCHTRVNPGERTTERFHEALLRHHGRVRLTEPEWTDLEAFLTGQDARKTVSTASPSR
jgi:hypothetical protein